MPVDRYGFGGLIFSMIYQFSKLHSALSNKAGLYRGQPRVLTILKNSEGCTLSELSELCGIGMPSLSVSVRNMEKAGLIRKTPGRDGRLQLIYLEEEGYKRAQSFHEEIDIFFKDFLDYLGDEDAEHFNDCLQKFDDYLKAANTAE